MELVSKVGLEPLYEGAYPVKWNITVAGGKESNTGNFLSGRINRKVAITVRKKILAMPRVAASEKGPAQTIRVYTNGVVGQSVI